MSTRSKLEHLRDIAEDPRMSEKTWNTDRIFGSVAGGVFFTALGGLLNISQLPDYGKVGCVCGLLFGLFISLYCFVKEHDSYEQKGNLKNKITSKVQEIMNQMNKHEPS